jgi:hypothetical protein
MPQMPFRYALTFESITLPPLTIRGEVIAGSTQAGARLAVKDAMSHAKGKRWSSLSLLLERPEEAAAVETQQATAEPDAAA